MAAVLVTPNPMEGSHNDVLHEPGTQPNPPADHDPNPGVPADYAYSSNNTNINMAMANPQPPPRSPPSLSPSPSPSPPTSPSLFSFPSPGIHPQPQPQPQPQAQGRRAGGDTGRGDNDDSGGIGCPGTNATGTTPNCSSATAALRGIFIPGGSVGVVESDNSGLDTKIEEDAQAGIDLESIVRNCLADGTAYRGRLTRGQYYKA
ncbi:hypothetical protein Pelo_19018 [Pelomyxa schiedti]|nr:hypothetical protein Pelo_19018 [Pelomyxa schiedti]